MANDIISEDIIGNNEDFDDMHVPDSTLLSIPNEQLFNAERKDSEKAAVLQDVMNTSFSHFSWESKNECHDPNQDEIKRKRKHDTNSRFKVISTEEMENTLRKRVPENTRSATNFGLNTFKAWAEFRNQQPETALDPMGKFNLLLKS